MISAILTELMVFSTNSTAAYSRFGRQQFTVQDAFSRLNRDIEGAEKISFEDCIAGNEYKTISLTINGELRKWKFDGGKLYFDSTVVVEGLTDESKFVYNLTEKNLTVILMPESTNEGRFRFNLKNPLFPNTACFIKM